MTIAAISIPDEFGLNLHTGEKIQFQALVQEDGSFLVTHVLPQQPTPVAMPSSALSDAPGTLGEWAHKWAGTLHVAEDESAQSLRDAYLAEKFGI